MFTLAETKRILDWDLRGAEAEYLRAFEIDSNSTTSNYFIAAFYAAIGEREKALTYLSRTAKIDPASLWVSNFACEIYRYFGLIDEAMAAGERSLQLDPTFLYSEPLVAALYREMGRFDDAIALYKKSQDLSGRVPFGLAITYGKMNRREEAREILKAACASRGSYTPGDAIAHVHVVLNEHEDAMRELATCIRGTFLVIALHRHRSRICAAAFGQAFRLDRRKNWAETSKGLCGNSGLIIER